MPEDKDIKQENNRMAVLLDYKSRIIDLTENQQVAPLVGIYDEPVRYFKANLEWCKLIFGWLAHMENVAFWPDAEDDNHEGIQAILVFEEGIEMATAQDIRDGMYAALNDIAKQIVSGRITNIAVGDDGTVSDPTTAGDSVPSVEDDPATVIREDFAARAGGVIAIRRKIQLILTDIAAWNAGSILETDVVARLELLHGLEGPEVAAFVDYYYHVDFSPSSGIALQDILESRLFCRGITVEQFASYAIKDHTVNNEKETLLQLSTCLTAELFSEWFTHGLASSAYLTYTCTPAGVETFALDMSLANAPQYTTNAIYKQGHRLNFKISGSFVDSDVPNEIRDFFYLHNTATGVKTFEPTFFNIAHAANLDPSQADVPFSPSHVYEITRDTQATAGDSTITVIRDNGTSFVLPNVVGTLNFIITDLGEYLV